jgi:hypothetical protein
LCGSFESKIQIKLLLSKKNNVAFHYTQKIINNRYQHGVIFKD